jgi:hypothetical protein
LIDIRNLLEGGALESHNETKKKDNQEHLKENSQTKTLKCEI